MEDKPNFFRTNMTGEKGNIRKSNSANKILIVSNNLEALRDARTYLSREGYSVMTASTIEEAMQLCRKSAPRLFICDLGFPPGFSEKLLAVLQVFFQEEKKN